jgi:hypothetical protein
MLEIGILVAVLLTAGIYVFTRKRNNPTSGGSDKPNHGDETNNQN